MKRKDEGSCKGTWLKERGFGRQLSGTGISSFTAAFPSQVGQSDAGYTPEWECPLEVLCSRRRGGFPNAVGVDIGCGMAYAETNIKVADIRRLSRATQLSPQAVIGDIMRNVRWDLHTIRP